MGVPIPIDEERLIAICLRYGIQELDLFGSVLRADFTPESDVDVLVEFQVDAPVRSLFDFIRVKHALEDEIFHRPVDLVDRSTLSRYVRQHVLDSRRPLYVAAH
jgi:predicted nucleotidyltransferase